MLNFEPSPSAACNSLATRLFGITKVLSGAEASAGDGEDLVHGITIMLNETIVIAAMLRMAFVVFISTPGENELRTTFPQTLPRERQGNVAEIH